LPPRSRYDRRVQRRVVVVLCVVGIGCGGSASDPDAGLVDGAAADAVEFDAPVVDAASPDSGVAYDAGPFADAMPFVACSGGTIAAGGGDQAMVWSQLSIAALEDGFDLDGDQQPDNKMSALSSLAQGSIGDAFDDQTIIVLLELFDYAGTGLDGCVDIGFYEGTFGGCGMTGENPCTPYDSDTPNTIDIAPEFVRADGVPVHVFGAATISGNEAALYAEPGTAHITIPITVDLVHPMPIAGAILIGTVVAGQSGPEIIAGRLGGVLPGYELERIVGLDVPEVGIDPSDTLLDAYFANILGPILALPSAPAPYDACRTPDIDVDGDGLEIFCDSDQLDAFNRVDTCIDGDGTVIVDTVNPDQTINQCSQAVDANGKPRFVDGISIAVDYEAVPAELVAP
jgi:hypothetical protein